jgi:hypothetical protein
MAGCTARSLPTFWRGQRFGVLECTTAEAAELVIAASGLELRAAVADQNLDGQMVRAG